MLSRYIYSVHEKVLCVKLYSTLRSGEDFSYNSNKAAYNVSCTYSMLHTLETGILYTYMPMESWCNFIKEFFMMLGLCKGHHTPGNIVTDNTGNNVVATLLPRIGTCSIFWQHVATCCLLPATLWQHETSYHTLGNNVVACVVSNNVA